MTILDIVSSYTFRCKSPRWSTYVSYFAKMRAFTSRGQDCCSGFLQRYHRLVRINHLMNLLLFNCPSHFVSVGRRLRGFFFSKLSPWQLRLVPVRLVPVCNAAPPPHPARFNRIDEIGNRYGLLRWSDWPSQKRRGRTRFPFEWM